jgi:hypothetical protein
VLRTDELNNMRREYAHGKVINKTKSFIVSRTEYDKDKGIVKNVTCDGANEIHWTRKDRATEG